MRLRDNALRIAPFSHDAERMIVLDMYCELLLCLGTTIPPPQRRARVTAVYVVTTDA